MMKSRMMLCVLAAASLMLSACAPLLSGLGTLVTGSSSPPQAPAQVVNISRGAVDFALNAFDAGLYAFDLAMDLGKPKAGSPEAKRIAGVGRQVVHALAAVEAARDAGNAASYEEAFRKANESLTEFRALLGKSPVAALSPTDLKTSRLSSADRLAILERAAA